MPDRDDLDHLIYEALASYADPGPNSGLERRVLARISATQTSARHRTRLIWAAALPAAITAGVLLLFFTSPSRHAQPNSRPKAEASIEKPLSAPFGTLSAPPRVAVRSGTRKTAHHAILHASDIPKLDVFPTPAPLSSEEKALVGLVVETPIAERQNLTAKWLQPDEPIHIAAISVPTTNPPAEGKE